MLLFYRSNSNFIVSCINVSRGLEAAGIFHVGPFIKSRDKTIFPKSMLCPLKVHLIKTH